MDKIKKKVKISCMFTTIPVIVKAILLIVGIIAGIVLGVEALGDSNGGGWILFILFLLGIFLVPAVIAYVVEFFTWLAGMKTRKHDELQSLKFWSISSLANLIIDVGLSVFMFAGFKDDFIGISIAFLIIVAISIIQFAIVLSCMLSANK